MRSVLDSNVAMAEQIPPQLPGLLKVIIAEKAPIERVRRIISAAGLGWNYQDEKIRIVHHGTQGKLLNRIEVYLKTEPPTLVYSGYRQMIEIVSGETKVLGKGQQWTDHIFHAGKWCEHLFSVFMARVMEKLAAEQAKVDPQKADLAERFKAAEDDGFFGAK